MWPLVVLLIVFGFFIAILIGIIKGLFHRKSRIVILTIAILIAFFVLSMFSGDGVIAFVMLLCYYAIEYVIAQRRTAPWGVFTIAILIMLLFTDSSYISHYHYWDGIDFDSAAPTLAADIPESQDQARIYTLNPKQNAARLRVDHATAIFATGDFSDEEAVLERERVKSISAIYTIPQQKYSEKRLSLIDGISKNVTTYTKVAFVYPRYDFQFFFLEWKFWIIIAAIADIIVCILKAIYVHKTYI